MGLSDIDEDEPATHSPSRTIVLAPSSAAPPAVVIPAKTTLNVGYNTAKSNQSASCSSNSVVGASVSGGSVLDDLFASMDVNASPTWVSSPTAGKSAPITAATAPSVLDDLFAAPVAGAGVGGAKSTPATKGNRAKEGHAVLYVDGNGSGADDDGANLFDLSKPVRKEKYSNAESLLDAFERQGKKCRGDGVMERETLANLTRNKDDNKVRARLLALMNYYDVLGVAQTASEEEIKRSYKKKALELHPDRVGQDQTPEEAELFKVITKAHEVLTDPAQRRQYDASLRGGQSATAASASDWWTHVSM